MTAKKTGAKRPAYDALAVAKKEEQASMERLIEIRDTSEDECAVAVACGEIIRLAHAERLH